MGSVIALEAGRHSAFDCMQVYDLVDGSDGFFTNRIHADYRSHTAIPFRSVGIPMQCCGAIHACTVCH